MTMNAVIPTDDSVAEDKPFPDPSFATHRAAPGLLTIT